MLPFEKHGSGIPILFLHAFPLSRRMWDINQPALSRNFQFISVDLPGFGHSEHVLETTTMEYMAKQVKETLDANGVTEKMVVCGLSMGGYVLFQLYQLIPDRIRAVGLFSTRSTADTPEGREKRLKTITAIEEGGMATLSKSMIPNLLGETTIKSGSPLVDRLRREIEGADSYGVRAALRGMAARPDSTPMVQQMKVPALVLGGSEDKFIPPFEAESLAMNLKGAEFHTVPAAGHLLNLEQPERFNDFFLHFLKRRVL